MKQVTRKFQKLFFISLLLIISMACTVSNGVNETPARTPIVTPSKTPTPPIGGIVTREPDPEPNRCDNLSGELEIKILVGPADAVGLEPFAIGSLPFTVTKEGNIYLINGGGSILYEDILEEEWGTYTVKFDMVGVISGMCEDNSAGGVLNTTIEMSGEQMVEVRAEGFQNDYPWSGTHSFDLSFPIEESATAEGEGWMFILHLN